MVLTSYLWQYKIAPMKNNELVRRAMVAYFKVKGDGRGMLPQPANTSGVEECGGRVYIVLRNSNGVLAVYRVRNTGLLRRLKRWPKVIGT